MILSDPVPSWLDSINPQVHDIWCGAWMPGTIEPGRRLIDHELVLFGRGECEVELEDGALRCGPKTFLIIPPGVLHVTRAGPDPVFRYCVHFDWTSDRKPPHTPLWSYARTGCQRELERPAPAHVPTDLMHGSYRRTPRIESRLREAFDRWSRGDQVGRRMCRPLLLETLLQLLIPETPATSPARVTDIASRTRTLLDNLPHSEHHSLIPLLETLGYSYAHLCRKFTAKYGIAPLQYVTRARMERAKTLLRDRGMKVAAVAEAVGYQDVGYFIRVFRKHIGTTPGRFIARSPSPQIVSK